jgi:hypothetical protein
MGVKVVAAIYLLMGCCSITFLPVVIACGYIRSSWLTLPVAFAIFACHPLMSAEVAFGSGNLGNVLYVLILIAGIPGVRRNRWSWFFLMLIVASVFKPPFLAFLLLPLWLGSGQKTASAGAASIVLLEAMIERLVWPQQYKSFVESVLFQVTVLQDTGIGLVRYFIHFHLGAGPPLLRDNLGYLVHGILMSGIVAGFWILRRRNNAVPDPVWVAAVLLMAVLANPRIEDYDVVVAVIPATFILVESTKALLRPAVKVVFATLGALAFLLLTLRSAAPAMFSYLLIAALIVLTWGYLGNKAFRDTPAKIHG